MSAFHLLLVCTLVIILSASAPPSSSAAAIQPPLITRGSSFFDATGHRVHLHGANWYGFDQEMFVAGGLHVQTLEFLVDNLVSFGFNAVRVPFSNDLIAKNPVVNASSVAANPSLVGMHAMDILDVFLTAVTARGLLVLLDNHISTAEWCCSGTDGNGLWWTADYSEAQWLAQWTALVTKYANNPYIFALDIRNEPRSTTISGQSYSAQWGTGGDKQDWHAAATRAANALLQVNPKLLIFVEGINYSNDLQGIGALPISVNVSSLQQNIVYAPHTYSWQQSFSTCSDLFAFFDAHWGYLEEKYNYPLVVTEFGVCDDQLSCVNDTAPNSSGLFFQCWSQYVKQYGLSWFTWTYNGTRMPGTVEGFGVVDENWEKPSQYLLPALQAIMLEF